MNKSKTWPIQSETSCYLKWSWSTIYLNKSTTASCHRTVHNALDVENFDNFHNLPKKIEDRTRMLAGQWPEESETGKHGLSGCTYCKYIEDSGGASDRIVQMQNLPGVFKNHTNVIPPELMDDPAAVEVTPTILEVYFNNVCNMACLYCGPHFSSLWEEENRRFGSKYVDGILVNPEWQRDSQTYMGLTDKLFSWLQQHGHKLWNFGMLGGEPFFQKEFDMVLDHWDNYPNPDLTLTIVTNLKVEHRRFVKYIDRIRQMVSDGKIKSLNLSASLDCWGPQAEYLRWGLDLDEWTRNFAYMVPQEWITLNVNITITPLSIKTLPDLMERINSWNQERLIHNIAARMKIPTEKISAHQDRILELVRQNRVPASDVEKHICVSFMHVVEPTQMNPLWFGAGVFTEDMQRVLSLMPTDTDYQRNYKEYMSGIANSIEKTSRDDKKVLMLRDYLDSMDQRRNLNWRTVFPWLVDEFSKSEQNIVQNDMASTPFDIHFDTGYAWVDQVINRNRGKPLTLLTIGDSWTWGDEILGANGINQTGLKNSNSAIRESKIFGKLLSDNLNANWVQHAMPGASWDWIVTEFEKLVPQLASKTEDLLVILGFSDHGRELDIENTKRHRSPMIDHYEEMFRTTGYRIVDVLADIERIYYGRIDKVLNSFPNVRCLTYPAFTDITFNHHTHLPCGWAEFLLADEENLKPCVVQGSGVWALSGFLEETKIITPAHKHEIGEVLYPQVLERRKLMESRTDLFYPRWHPKEIGHQRWASYLTEYITKNILDKFQ